MQSCKIQIVFIEQLQTIFKQIFSISFHFEDLNYSLSFINIKIQFASNQIQSDVQGINSWLEYEYQGNQHHYI